MSDYENEQNETQEEMTPRERAYSRTSSLKYSKQYARDKKRREREKNSKRNKGEDTPTRKCGKTKTKKGKTIALTALAVFLGIIAVAAVSIAILATVWLQDLPDYKSLDSYDQTGTTTIYASDGETKLAEISLINRIKVSPDQIDSKAKDALVAVEDERFYEHGAIDALGIARAVVSTVRGNTQGGSTLTQQLVRNTILLDEMHSQTLERKVREMYIAMKLEEEYSKDEILATYLNVVNFGNGNYGIEAASRDYFGHSADELTLSEASFLVGIPNSPNQYNPRENYDAALERQTHVLNRMLANGYITQDEYAEAKSNPPAIVEEHSSDKIESIAPYFVDYIKQLVTNDKKYSMNVDSDCGYSIYTTLDVDDQKAANEAIQEVLERYDDLDGSLTAINPANGDIMAMVGGRDYETNKFNLSTQMSRQPGSTFKPFTLIAAMQLGMSPDTRIDSTAPAKITEDWTVNNVEGHGSGYMTLERATTNSVNTVYARVAHEIGAQAIVDTAHALGIKSDLNAVESITLGTQGVNTLEMASAYATIAAGGIYHEPVAITKITNAKGDTVFEHEYDDGIRVIDESIAALATKVMETVITSGTGTGARLSSGQVAAGKTGTSEYGSDLWFCGFTPQLAAAVWTGTRDNSATSLYGSTTSTPAWRIFMNGALEDWDVQSWPKVDTDKVIWRSDWTFSALDKQDEAKRKAEIEKEEAAAEAARKATEEANAEIERMKQENANGYSSNTSSGSSASTSSSHGN